MSEDKEKSKPQDENIEAPVIHNTNLMDPSYPLLKEMRENAPGTHKHSQSLVSMVENVCAAIEMDPTKLKLAALYHDVGKLIDPKMFSENQDKDNIHDKLDPHVSYSIITRHVSDSIMILTAEDFPADVIDIVSRHHGNCVLRSIYNKARAQKKSVELDEFRYRTPKPNSIESLVLMLCDAIEASSRSIYLEQKKEVDPAIFVSEIYNKLHLDGQFDNVSILLGKLKKIQSALISDVASNFQKRVSYGDTPNLVDEENLKIEDNEENDQEKKK